MTTKPKKIYIDDRATELPLTKRVTRFFSATPTEYISDSKSFIKNSFKRRNAISEGKKSIFITINKGKFVSKCPGTKNYICCGYQILHPASQCTLDCSYCILQSYFNNPFITFFANTDEMLAELDTKISANPARLWRIGTGEFTDSLVFDNVTGLSKTLIPYFKKKANAILELKTKTVEIQNLLTLNPQGKVVLSFSLNAASITKKEEHGAASIRTRLAAAQKAAQRGYKIGLHFDPMFYFNGWEKEYKKTVRLIFQFIAPSSIAWISLGCFRYMPSLKNIITNRFPASNTIYNEFITGLDGKKRYPKPIRIEMYRAMHQWIRSYNSRVFIYLCMESNDVWKKSFGYTPRSFGSLKKALDAQVFPHATTSSK